MNLLHYQIKMWLHKIIFTDTNVILGLYRTVALHNSDLKNSMVAQYAVENNNIYISTFVLEELERIALRQDIIWNKNLVRTFLSLTQFQVYASTLNWDRYYHDFVYDVDDAQIVQDAHEIGVTHILTRNIKDFNISKIKNELKIEVIIHL